MSQSSSRSFVSAAKLIGLITLLSRFVGLAREMIAIRAFGDTGVWAAWKVAFTVPNLFRKLLGEGALSAAFIPLYAQAVQHEEAKRAVPKIAELDQSNPDAAVATIRAETQNEGAGIDDALSGPIESDETDRADLFAAASVNLLAAILVALTILGELVLAAVLFTIDFLPDRALMIQFSMLMLPYVTLVCMTAFLGGILQVHHRFAAVAFTSVVLNLLLIAAIVGIAWTYDLSVRQQQIIAGWWLSGAVLISGVAQLLVLVPSLRAAGFRVRVAARIWTPAVKKMLLLSGPVALGAGVLQLGVLLDKGVALFLAGEPGHETFTLFNHTIAYPILQGAAARLDLAQFMYQFPLGVFAISLATAIFPQLGREASDPASGGFARVLRQGIEAALFIGLPASAGMILVAEPAVKLLFVGGEFSADKATLVSGSLVFYAGAIWAFSLLQIVNRAYYALQDSRTPLIWMTINLLLNLVVEIPLLFTSLGERAMAVGTLVSFTIQAVAMLLLIDRRVGGLGLRSIALPIGKMTAATMMMTAACVAVIYSPVYPHGTGRVAWASQSVLIVIVGGGAYLLACAALGLDVKKHLPRKRMKKSE